MAVRRTSHRFTLQHSIVQNSEASDWLRGVRREYKGKIKRWHFTAKTLQSKLSLNFNTVMTTYMDVSFQSSIKTQHVQHARWELQKLVDVIKTKASSSISLSFNTLWTKVTVLLFSDAFLHVWKESVATVWRSSNQLLESIFRTASTPQIFWRGPCLSSPWNEFYFPMTATPNIPVTSCVFSRITQRM